MKLLVIIVVQLLIAAVLGFGLYLAIAKGSFWLLTAGLLAYTVMFAKIGCLPSQSH